LLTGKNKHSIDAKGRVIIPAKLKEQLGTVITILKGDDNCLRLYSETEWAKYTEKISQLPPTKNRALIRYIYSNAIEVIPDAQGRVILPPEMIAFAGIQRDVMILGCGLYAEIWAFEIWKENNMEEPPEDMRGQMEELGL